MQIFGLTITWTFDLILFILFLIALSVLIYFKKKEVLARLKEAGKIKRIGPDKGGHWEILK